MSYKVSVVIPSYKREAKILKRAIETILAQTYENVEVIVVDDNAGQELRSYRNNVEEMIKCYEDNPKVIYRQNQRNLGGALARNEGIASATGDYITFLDDDDIYLPNKIDNQLKYMIQNDLDMSFTDLRIHNEEDFLTDFREYSGIKSFDNKELLRYHLTRHITGTNTFMYRSEFLRKIGGFRQAKVGQEFYLMMRTIEGNGKIGYLKKQDVILYRHKGECISTGANKIPGEKELYQYKQGYFNELSRRDKRFIRFRHYVVLAVACKRNKRYTEAFGLGVKSVYVSPLDTFIEIRNFIFKVIRNRGRLIDKRDNMPVLYVKIILLIKQLRKNK